MHSPLYIYISVSIMLLNMFFISRHFNLSTSTFYKITMETAAYWPMAREYGIWNAAITSLQFWEEDLAPVTLGEVS